MSARVERVAAALAELEEQQSQVLGRPGATPAEAEVWAARLALICARKAGWWRVLSRSALGQAVPPVWGKAAYLAGVREREAARRWREYAAGWRREQEALRELAGVEDTGDDR